MAEGGNVRLVRCPKCENLLPELPDYSVYQCGGCGAVLKAKKKGIPEDGMSETSSEVKGIGVAEESSVVKASEVDMDNVDGIEAVKVERPLSERVASNGNSKSLAENREVLADSDISKRGKESLSQGLVRDRNLGKSCELDVDRSEYEHFKSGNTVKENRPPMESSRSRPVVDEWGAERNFLYHDEGPSSYGLNSHYEHDDVKTRYQGRNLGRVESLDSDRAELLRKLEELRDQITRSCDVADKPLAHSDMGRVPHLSHVPGFIPSWDRHGSSGHVPYVQEGLASSQDANKKPLAPNDTGRAPHSGYIPGFIPSRDRYGSSGFDPYAHEGLTSLQDVNKKPLAPDDIGCAPYSSYTPGFVPSRDMYGPSGPDPYIQNGYPREFLPYDDMYVPRQPHSRYMHRPHHDHFRGYYDDFNQEHFMLQHHENILHKNWHMPRNRVDPSGLHNPNFHHHHPNPIPSRVSNLYPLHSRRPVTLNPVNLDSQKNGFNYHAPTRVAVDHRGARVRHPVAGGAPFITCSNCFEVLKLPNKNVSLANDQQKLKCGACSSIISFELGNEGFISSVSPPVGEIPSGIGEGSMDENMRNWKYESIFDKKSNSCESEKQLGPLSLASSLSEDEESPETSILSKNCEFEKGNKSKRSEPEMVSLEYSNSCASQNSSDQTSKDDHLKVNKGSESFFTGFIKKSLRDFMKSNQSVENGGSQVSINGHFIPDRVVKKAEKLAGPIRPGEYWYDKRAGFWGVMGHPCLGIVMPNIEEFNYPMPENCAAGNTGVFVNGRELNEKDLELLASRGLPTTKRKSYIIDITGKVVDEHSGEELDGLGRLAPTVEKAKHGFGMKVPRNISQSRS